MATSRRPLATGDTVADILFNGAVRHTVEVERFKAGLTVDAERFIRKRVVPDLTEKLAGRLARIKSRGFDSGVWTTKRLRDLNRAMREVIVPRLDEMYAATADDMMAFGRVEQKWQRLKLVEAASPVQLSFELPLADTVNSIVRSTPMRGATMRQWFGGLKTTTIKALEREVKVGLIEGETTTQIVQRVQGNVLTRTMLNDARTIVRTAVNHTMNGARQTVYDDPLNASRLKGVQWVSTLDRRTTMVCIDRDGVVYPVDDGFRPPAHRNCRSYVVPVLKSADDLAHKVKHLPESTRASMNGQVSQKIKYPQWLKGQPNAVHEEVLGVRKAQLWRQGKLKISEMYDQTGREMSLAEIGAVHGIGV